MHAKRPLNRSCAVAIYFRDATKIRVVYYKSLVLYFHSPAARENTVAHSIQPNYLLTHQIIYIFIWYIYSHHHHSSYCSAQLWCCNYNNEMWSRFVSGWSSMSARPSSIQIKWSDFIILGHSKKWWKCLCSESRPFPLHSMWVTQADFIRNVHQYYFCIVKYSKFWIYVHTRQPFTFDFMKSEILVWNTVYNVSSSNESYKYVTYLNVTLIAHLYSSSSEYTSFSVH